MTIFFDNDEVAEKGSHKTYLITSDITTGNFIKTILKDHDYYRSGPEFFNLFAVRLVGEQIVYQVRLEESEKIFDIRFLYF